MMDTGRVYVHTDVDPWRSIFDMDRVAPIAQYRGDCNAVDAYVKDHPGLASGMPLTTKAVADRMEKAMGSTSPSTNDSKPGN